MAEIKTIQGGRKDVFLRRANIKKILIQKLFVWSELICCHYNEENLYSLTEIEDVPVFIQNYIIFQNQNF